MEDDRAIPNKLLKVADVVDIAERALRSIGFSIHEAEKIATPMIDAELCGYPSLGLARILTIFEHPRSRQKRTPVQVIHETPVSALIDGGNHVGFYALQNAAETAIEKAQTSGLCMVGVHNSYLSGRNAFYVEKIAKAGLIGIHIASGPAVVVPFGGNKPVFGTNPISFGIPRPAGDPYVFDMGTAAITHGDVVFASRMKRSLPDGVAVDAQGQPTVDPGAALLGGIMPFGGYKGYGLAMSIQALCLLAGASRPRNDIHDFAFLFMVAKRDLLVPAQEFERDIEALIEEVEAASVSPSDGGVRIPSQRAFSDRERHRREGIRVPVMLLEKLAAL
jgi:LDH2 family malate/lactate/ureidoglycolate dehydrogenase